MLRSPTAAGEHGGVEGVLVVAADEHDAAGRGSASQASLEPKPGAPAVMQTAPGMCASSNCSSVRTSTTQRAVVAGACSTWRGVSGCAVDASRCAAARG